MIRRIVLAVLVIAVVVGAVRLVKYRKQQLASIRVAEVAAVPVVTGQVLRAPFVDSRRYYGVLASDRQAVIRARTIGQVTHVFKRESMPVKAGEVLVELDGLPDSPSGTRAMLTESIGNVRRAVSDMALAVKNLQRIYDRDRMLYERGAVSKQVMEQSESRWKEARIQLFNLKNELAGLREKLAFFTVRAPFDGRVATVSVDEGDVVNMSQPLVTIQNDTPCKVVVTVASGDLAALQPGTPAVVESQGHRLDCRLTRVYPAADGGAGTVEIVLDQPPFGLPLGASVGVRLETRRIDDALVVPVNAVLTGVERAMVFAVVNGKVHPVPVSVLAESDTAAAVDGDLQPGQAVVRGSDSLLMRLADGTAVTPAKEAR